MRLLILVPRQEPVTGNRVTALRLGQGLRSRGHTVVECEVDPAEKLPDRVVEEARPELVLLLHAYRSGRPWLGAGRSLPFAVLLTGTDIHEDQGQPERRTVITAVLERAAAVLIQNPLLADRVHALFPGLGERLHLLPPAIVLGETPWPCRERLSLRPGERLFLCPAGVRPVKGVVELLGLFDPLAAGGRRFRVAFCGPVLDAAYGREFAAALAARPWASHLGVVPPEAMASVLRQADVVLNNSVSEGLSNALAEAAALGRPILARDIPGNAAVVEDGVNGLLYRDAAGFCRAACRLLDDPSLLAALSHPRPDAFSPQRESAELERVCLAVLAGRRPSTGGFSAIV